MSFLGAVFFLWVQAFIFRRKTFFFEKEVLLICLFRSNIMGKAYYLLSTSNRRTKMMFSPDEKTITEILKLYQEGKSTAEIAELRGR